MNRPPDSQLNDADRRFWDFHEANPDIYLEFVQRAMALWINGRTKYGARAIFQIIRYNTIVSGSKDDYKINNNYIARYARMAMAEAPQLKDFFRTRYIDSKCWPEEDPAAGEHPGYSPRMEQAQ